MRDNMGFCTAQHTGQPGALRLPDHALPLNPQQITQRSVSSEEQLVPGQASVHAKHSGYTPGDIVQLCSGLGESPATSRSHRVSPTPFTMTPTPRLATCPRRPSASTPAFYECVRASPCLGNTMYVLCARPWSKDVSAGSRLTPALSQQMLFSTEARV